jgi:hypothetical protein
MGRNFTEGMAEAERDGLIDLNTAIRHHLQHNFYPPVHTAFVDTALEAITNANNGDYDTEVTMANGLVRTTAFVIDGLRLEAFIYETEAN